MTRSRAIWWGLVLSALLWVPSSSLAQGDASKSCGCTEQDLLDVESRILVTQRAMDELDRMIKEWSTPTKATVTMQQAADQAGMDVDVEDFRDLILMKDLGFGMTALEGARRWGGKTDPACDVIFKDANQNVGNPPKCLKLALIDHENVHVKICKAKKQSLLEWMFNDWKDKETVADYLKEERLGYQTENERLKQEQQKQPKTPCTELDKSAKGRAKAAGAQSQRNNDSANRLSGYGDALKCC